MNNILRNNKVLKITILTLFIILGLISLRVPFRQILGTNTNFTLFDFVAPTASSFFGGIFGTVSILIMKIIDVVVRGAEFDKRTLVLMFPVLFGNLYFMKKNKFNLAIPALAILAFNLHPIGRTVWYYSLFWTIPMAMYFLRDKFLFARSLGATFTQHAVGGVLFIYAFNLPASFWNSLIPVVFLERFIIAAGLTLSYMLLHKLILFFSERYNIGLNIEKKLNLLGKK